MSSTRSRDIENLLSEFGGRYHACKNGSQPNSQGAKELENYTDIFLSLLDTVQKESYDKGYSQGVHDEIECVEKHGEHLDLQKKLKEGK